MEGKNITAISGGVTYNFNDPSPGNFIRLMDWDGMGISSVDRLAQRSPGQLGDTDIGAFQNARFINLNFKIAGSSLSEYRTVRKRFIACWRPRQDDPVTLTFDWGGDVKYSADVYPTGPVDPPMGDRSNLTHDWPIIVKASDPRLYHPAQDTTIQFDLVQSGDDWVVPWDIPWGVSASQLAKSTTFTYANGDATAAAEFPVIVITGPMTNPILTVYYDPVVTSEAYFDTIDLSDNGGLQLAVGDTLTIDLTGGLRRQSKTMRLSDDSSVQQFLSLDSDLQDFRFSPIGEKIARVAGVNVYNTTGVNKFEVSGTSANQDTAVQVNYYNRFLGM